MNIKARALLKGLSDREWQGKHYHKAELFGLEGSAADLSVEIDPVGQKNLMEVCQKHLFQPVEVVMDMTFFDKRSRFQMVSVTPVKA